MRLRPSLSASLSPPVLLSPAAFLSAFLRPAAFLCLSVSLCLAATATATAAAAATAAVVLVPVAPARAQDDPLPGCAGPEDRQFPLTTRIRGGPASYVAGGGSGSWYLDLANTTRGTCAGIHPIVVLVDDKHALKSSQPRMEFHDGARVRPVRFETTDEDELVGAFQGDGFNGFTVAPGATVTVRVTLSVTADAEPETVTANAAVVQRRGDDGDWVGQSNDYRFTVAAGRAPTPTASGGGEDTGSSSAAPHAEAGQTPGGLYGIGPAVLACAAAIGLVLSAAVALRARRRH
ncbi:hypothetical protein [Streptomyces sp. NPDC004629]|uniref:hypothetical protein n=1 Tax=Streptomyces sp. NPDC004629 TaxID=3364705 RepID=UPI0036C608CB